MPLLGFRNTLLPIRVALVAINSAAKRLVTRKQIREAYERLGSETSLAPPQIRFILTGPENPLDKVHRPLPPTHRIRSASHLPPPHRRSPAMKFGICNEIFQNWKLADAMSYAKQAGYDCIELAPFTLLPGTSHKYVTAISATERTAIRETAARIGIEISGIHWVLVQADDLHLTHPDATVRQRTADYFVALADFCADLGGRSIIVGSPKQRSLLDGVTPAEAWERATAAFRPAVARAADRGVTLCFEPLAPSETNFINTAAEAIAFAQQFDRPAAMSVILDVKAMSSEAKPVPEVIRESRGGFAYFHANDANLKGPGFGDVDFVPIAAALREVGYDGVVSVEVFKFEEGPEVIAAQSLAYLRRAFAPPAP